jgi:hypothetical protein
MSATIPFGRLCFVTHTIQRFCIFRYEMQISHKYTMNLRIIGEMELKKAGFG